ncbi:hypothetical protein NQZ68_014753 [Dissostichus eleginoides]|nr:hypothetical protein NQZ68_014753 [Dissostichus eleginoides]
MEVGVKDGGGGERLVMEEDQRNTLIYPVKCISGEEINEQSLKRNSPAYGKPTKWKNHQKLSCVLNLLDSTC